MLKKLSIQSRRFVADRAIAACQSLSTSAKADVYEIVSHLLEGDEAAEAKAAAFSIRTAERHQMTLEALLRGK